MITNTNHMVCFLQVKSGQDSPQHSEAEADNIVLFPMSSRKYSLLIHFKDITYASLELLIPSLLSAWRCSLLWDLLTAKQSLWKTKQEQSIMLASGEASREMPWMCISAPFPILLLILLWWDSPASLCSCLCVAALQPCFSADTV